MPCSYSVNARPAMNKLFITLYDFFERRRALLCTVLAVLVAAMGAAALQLRFSENITGFFPDGERKAAAAFSNRHFLRMRRLSAPETLTWKSFKQGMLVCHQAFFPRHTLVEPYNLQYRFSADFDWCIRIMKKARTLHNTHLTIIDYLEEGMTTRNQKASLKERFRIMAKHYGLIGTVAHHAWFVIRAVTHQ